MMAELVEKEGVIIYPKKIEFLSEYLDIIEQLRELWVAEKIWFRGVSDSSYKLIPSIYRKEIWKYTQKKARWFYSEFKRKAKPFLDNGNKSLWELYQLMQHYGAPSRLLDWTEGSLIALFFALMDSDKTNNPCVWCIDPYNLNKISTNKELIYYSGLFSSKAESLVNKYLIDRRELPDSPIAILPNYSDKRIISQKSCFTIHGKNKNGIEEQFKDNSDVHIAKIVIDIDSVKYIMAEIVSTGISFSVLFPDLNGLAEELKYEFGMR